MGVMDYVAAGAAVFTVERLSIWRVNVRVWLLFLAGKCVKIK